MRHPDPILSKVLCLGLCLGLGLLGCTGDNPNGGGDGPGGGDGSTGRDGTMNPADGPGGGGDGGGGQDLRSGGGEDMMTAPDACAALAAAECKALDACSSFQFMTVYGDMTTCVARKELLCPKRLMAHGTSLTQDKVQACAGAWAAASCDDVLIGTPPDACRPQKGTVASGAACGDDWQCATTFCKLNGLCGTCASRGMAGANCNTSDDCDFGLACAAGRGPGGRCIKPAAKGQPCMFNTLCLPTLTCKMGQCAAPGAEGDACVPPRFGQADGCDLNKGLYCDNMTRKCAKVKYADAGAACGQFMPPPVYCTASATCNFTGMGMATCVAPAMDGAMCGGNPGGGAACMTPALCVGVVAMGGNCTVPDPSSCR